MTFFVIIGLVLAGVFHTGANVRAGDIPAGVHQVRSIDPADTEFDDLAALGEAIGDARIVMLGEQDHGGGSTFLAKTRVIEYLHEQHGFDVIAFESGLYDVYAAQQLIANGEQPSRALAKAIFPVWAESDEFQRLLAYMDQQQVGESPLRAAGFDLQLTNVLSAELPADLEHLNAQLPGDRAGLARISALIAALVASDPAALGSTTALASTPVEQIEADVAASVARLGSSPLPEADWWRQILESSGSYLVFLKGLSEPTPGVLNLRDAQMASNLSWLANTAFPDQKIIVWAATSHLLKERTLEPDPAPGMRPMGEAIHREFGQDAYLLAFTSYQGESASYATRDSTAHGTAPTGSIEDTLHQAGFDYAFLNSDDLAQAFPGRQTSWMLGFEPMSGIWDRAVDGIFFIDTMAPSTLLPAES